jgi:hypothetical protein
MVFLLFAMVFSCPQPKQINLQSRFAIMAAKTKRIAMSRRLAEVIECESVTTKSQLFNILKMNDLW